MAEATLGEIAAHLGGELVGDPGLRIDRISPLEGATPSSISFLSNPRFVQQLASTQAACVIVGPALRDAAAARGAVLVVPDAYLGFARLTQWWAARVRPAAVAGVHPSAVIDSSAVIAANVSIGPFVVIEAGAHIGEGAVIGAHSFVGAGASVGRVTRFAARVTLAYGCHIGDRGIVHSGVVIGADGFGFAASPEGAVKIEQLGGVRIGHDVEIGSNTCIDRGALEDTVLDDGVKIDNLVQIGHNVRIGKHSAVAGCAGVAGSTIIGSRCIIGGAAMVMGHLTLADGVIISAGSAVTRSILKPGTYTGFFPIDDNAAWEKNAATLRGLHAMRERLRALEKKDKLTMIDIHQILKILPHRYPILLVDRVVSLEKNKRIQAYKNVSINEPYFLGHFPHRPVMPGVLMLEALAQAAAILAIETLEIRLDDKTVFYFAGIDGVRFKRPVEPGDQLILDVTLERMKAGVCKFKARALVGEELAVEADLTCTMRRIA